MPPHCEYCESIALNASRNFDHSEQLEFVWGPLLKLNASMVSSGVLDASQYKITETHEGLLLLPANGTKPQAHNKQPLLTGRFHCDG